MGKGGAATPPILFQEVKTVKNQFAYLKQIAQAIKFWTQRKSEIDNLRKNLHALA